MKRIAALIAVTALGACSYGVPYTDAMNVPVRPAAVYRPLHRGSCMLLTVEYASATVIGPGYAVTNAHADSALDAFTKYIENDYADAALFKIEGGETPAISDEIEVGEPVISYGTGCDGSTRIAHGIITDTDAALCYGHFPTPSPVCTKMGYGAQRGMLIKSDSGGGFSGGPVIDMKGRVIGLTEGIMNGQTFAYRITDVIAGFQPVLDHPDKADWSHAWIIPPRFLLEGLLL